MKPQLKRFLLAAAAVLAVCLLLEGVAFQGDALRSRDLTPVPLDLERTETEKTELASEPDDIAAVMPSAQKAKPTLRTVVTFATLPETDGEILNAMLEFTGDTQLLRVRVELSDDAYSHGFASADTLLALPGTRAFARLAPNGRLRALRVIFETDDETAALAAVTLNQPRTARFSLFRFCCMLIPGLMIAASLCFRLWQAPLRRDNPLHRLAYLLTGCACVLAVLLVSSLCQPFDETRFPYTRPLEYPFESSVYRYRSLTHAVMYDMLRKGRLDVDETPDEALLALENPYDPSARIASDAEVMFDYALYNGRYYSYFGLTPVLLFYAPYCLLFGYLPAYTTAAAFFAVLTVLAAFLCVWEAARRWIHQPPLPLLCLGAAAVALGCNTLMVMTCADRYHLAIAAMQAFFFLTVWTALVACRQEKKTPRALCFALSALCSVLLVECRPSGALTAAGWLIPLFITVLCNHRLTGRQRTADALCFLVPLLAGAAAIMAYNAARFGSPFEFGQRWQLALEDIHYNRLRAGDFLQAIYYYYIDPLRLSPEFPFLSPGAQFVNHSGNFFYGVVSAGALSMPVTWGCAAVFALPHKRRRGKMGVYLCALLITLPVALLDYSIAGVAHRYVCDLLPSLCLVGMLALTGLAAHEIAEGRSRVSAVAASLFLLTLAVALCLAFGNYRGFISRYNPDAFLRLYRLFTLR